MQITFFYPCEPRCLSGNLALGKACFKKAQDRVVLIIAPTFPIQYPWLLEMLNEFLQDLDYFTEFDDTKIGI